MKNELRFLKAQNGDCFLLSFSDDDNNPRNILIDGGRDNAYYDADAGEYGELKIAIDLIRKREEHIDLLILSHIDNDHICGLLKWFEMDADSYKLIKNVWFNSGKLIADYLKEPENKDLNVKLRIFQSPETGVAEGIEFENYLLKHNIWNRKVLLKDEKLKEAGVAFQILSPDKTQLLKLLKEYKEISDDPAYTAAKEKDWKTPLQDFIAEEAVKGYKFEQDTSPKNGSSITFILTIQGSSFLFLGDSHPKGIVTALRELGYSEDKPLTVDFFKVAHHGSKSNTNHELLQLVKSDNYLISTDSSGHNHPNKRTLARILQYNPAAIFHFNYEHVKNNIMLDEDLKAFPEMKIKLTTKLDFK